MNYNKKLTENLQKLLHSRQTLMSSSVHHPSINSDRNIDDFDVSRKYNHNNQQLSSTAQLSDDSETIVSCSSKPNIRPSIEEVEAKKLVPCSEIRESQVRNNLNLGVNVILIG